MTNAAPCPDDPQPLYRQSDLRAVEALPLPAGTRPLMQRAGEAAADWARELCRPGRPAVLVLAGPGNNGGDAFVVATRLAAWSFDVRVVFAGDADRLPPDAAGALAAWRKAGGTTIAEIPEAVRWGLVVDGLFGIGLQRDLGGIYADLADTAGRIAAAHGCPLLALDCPSGLDADTGIVRGHAVRATHTISFIALKPGLLTADGPDRCGEVRVADLGLAVADAVPPGGWTIGRSRFAGQLRPRARNSHKGTFGSAGILGGAPGMVGAALLAGRAALKLGAGRVYVGLIDNVAPRVDPVQPELMLRDADALLPGPLAAPLDALAAGPGMGPGASALLARALDFAGPLVLDADAINLVAADPVLAAALAGRRAPSLLTPHPAEAARLLGDSVAAVQADRIAAAVEIARRTAAGVALKGCGTIVATPNGRWFVNTSGNPGMASAGMGDTLTGLVVALLAQGWDAESALLAGVHLHGAAADALAASGIGPIGLTAGEVGDAARTVFNRWVGGYG